MPPGRKGAGPGVSHKKREPPPEGQAEAKPADGAVSGRGKRARVDGLVGVLASAMLEPTSTRRSTRGAAGDGSDVKAEEGAPVTPGPVGVASAAGQRTAAASLQSAAGTAAQQVALRQCERRVQRIEFEQQFLKAGGNLLDIGLDGANADMQAPALRGAAAASAAAKAARVAAQGVPPSTPATRTTSGHLPSSRREVKETPSSSTVTPSATTMAPVVSAAAPVAATSGRSAGLAVSVAQADGPASSSTPAAAASPSPTVGPQQATWNIKVLKKQPEPQRNKVHWDYLLEEMEWLSKDFCEERQWKVALARKAAKAVTKWHQDRERSARDGDRSEEVQLKRLASHISREVREQWGQAAYSVKSDRGWLVVAWRPANGLLAAWRG